MLREAFGKAMAEYGIDTERFPVAALAALAVMDAAKVECAVVVAFSREARWGLLLAAEHLERVAGAAFIGPALPTLPLPRSFHFEA